MDTLEKKTGTIEPFGTKYIEELNDNKLPPVNEWSWKPEIVPAEELVRGSWSGQTCTRNCNDQKRDEM